MRVEAIEKRMKEIDTEIYSLLTQYYNSGNKDKALLSKANQLRLQYAEMDVALSNMQRGYL